MVKHRIVLVPNARTVRQAPYRLHPEKLRSINYQIDDQVVQLKNVRVHAPIFIVPQPCNPGRLCVDFRRLNALTEQ